VAGRPHPQCTVSTANCKASRTDGSNPVAAAAKALRPRGFGLCRIVPGEKKPNYSGWPTRSLEPSDFSPGDLMGVLGGPLSDGGRPGHAMAIIDLDAAEAVRLADEYLPATAVVEGRPSKPRSHRYFLVPHASIPDWAVSKAKQAAAAAEKAKGHPGPFKKSFRHRDTKKVAIDFLGTGGQCVCPPSLHPSDERREWVGGEPGEPAVVNFLDLWDAVGRLASACGAEIPRDAAAPLKSVGPRAPAVLGDVTRRAVAYLAKIPGAVSGAGGHRDTFWAARALVRGFLLPTEDALRLLVEEYNPRCKPAWWERELRHKVEDAARLPFGKPDGWLLDQDRQELGTRSVKVTNTKVGLRETPRPGPAVTVEGPPAQGDGNPPLPAEPEQLGHEPDGPRGGAGGDGDPAANLTDVGNGLRLVEARGEEVRFSPGQDWLVWDGRRWKRDDLGRAQEMAKACARELHAGAAAELANIARSLLAAPEQEAKQFKERQAVETARLNWAIKSEDARRVGACLTMARTDARVAVPSEAFDAHPHLFNVPNGTINLRTGRLRRHDRADLITRLAPVEYDPAATAPAFEQFLLDVTGGDAALFAWLARWFGYCLTGDVSEQAFAVLWGDGSNGKGTLCELMLKLFGDYGHKAEVELLLASRQERHSTERADLCGKRFVLASESGEGRRLNEALIKELTGGDSVTARHLYRNNFTFPPTWKINLLTNHRPHIRGTDHAIWRRPQLVPFRVTFAKPGEVAPPGAKLADKGLPKQLEGELPGILAWMVRGCVEWRADGLGTCEAIAAATREYRNEENIIAQFAAARVEYDRHASVQAGEVYRAYRAWHEETGQDGRAFSVQGFGRKLTKYVEEQNVSKDEKRSLYIGMRLASGTV
jgi:P4 family phage/plasmid primase-like protien